MFRVSRESSPLGRRGSHLAALCGNVSGCIETRAARLPGIGHGHVTKSRSRK